MQADVSQLLQWFVTSLLGGTAVKLVDSWLGKRQAASRRREDKAEAVLDYVRQYGELAEFYRFRAYLSMEVRMDEGGKPITGEDGEPVVDQTILEPEPRFQEAVAELTGTDLNSAITSKIASIRMASYEANDLAVELDPSGELKRDLARLYTDTVTGIEIVLKHKDAVDPGSAISQMFDALEKAGETRRAIRSRLEKLAQ